MKALFTILLVTFGLTSFAQGKIRVQKIDQLCAKSKRFLYPIVGTGYLLHMKCKPASENDFFIMLDSVDANSGILLNNAYKLTEKKLKVTSFGEHFFKVHSRGTAIYYKYDFTLDSWTIMETKPSNWRTSDRE